MITITTVIDRLQSHILSLNENDFTKQILIPLFKQLGYERVDFHGGPNEEGKDLICWKRDELGLVDLSVVQVKYYKPTAKAADKRSFSEVVTQLQQASEKRVPFLDGKLYPPSVVYLVTPYAINTRTLETRFEGIVGLKNIRIKIIDGIFLAELIDKHIPHIFGDLFGIGHVAIESLNNAELRNALNVATLKDLSLIYNDLDFAIGNITTKILLELQFKPTIKKISLTDNQWMDIKPICEKIRKTLKVKVIEEDLESINDSYKNQVEKNAEISRQIKKLHKKIEDQDIDSIMPAIMAGCRHEYDDFVVEIYKDIIKANNLKRDKYEEYLRSITSCINRLCDIKSKISNKNLLPLLKEYKRLYLNVSKLEDKKLQLNRAKKEPSYQVTIDGIKLANKLIEMQKSLRKSISKIKNEKRSKALMASFVVDCEEILLHSNTLLNIPIISDAIGVEKKQQFANVASFARLEFSVHEIFDSDSNTALYGDAGAGKTTTLQIYARKRIERDKNAIVFFISLAKAFNKLNIESVTDIDFTQILLDSIVNYLRRVEVDIDERALKDTITSKKSLIIFDGIDEVVEKTPWIIKAITSFHERYPKAQIIVSSRMTGSYVNEIPFVGLTLLPFTDIQRRNFFKMWFNDDNKVEVILKHLDKFHELNDIVRNPLLATIMCVLAEHSVPLPDTEIRLYEERFRLLLGHYDVHKQSSRIKSHHQDLWYIARKIAYYFHLNHVSYATKSAIVEALHEIYCTKMQPSRIDLGVDELNDPCNVLMPMTEDGQFGFGHLRFQEYLVACELKENRGLSIDDYLVKKTWRGALILFSQMTDDIEHIIENIIVFKQITPYIEAINAMLQVRPIEEREYLGNIVAKNLTQDESEIFIDYYKQSQA